MSDDNFTVEDTLDSSVDSVLDAVDQKVGESFDPFAGIEDQSMSANRVLGVTERNIGVVYGVGAEDRVVKESVGEEERGEQKVADSE